MFTIFVFLKMTCGCIGATQPEWSSIDDCDSMSIGQIRDDCYGHFLIDVFKQDANRGLRILQQDISDKNVRDFLYLEVTRKVDPTTTRYCQLIESPTLAKRCTTLVSRPHLHRETLRDNKKQPTPKRQPQ